MGRAFRCFPYVDSFCIIIYSMQSATLFIACFSMVRGIIISSYFFAPHCAGIRSNVGLGLVFYMFEGFQFGAGLFLLVTSILLAFSTCIEHPVVKWYIVAVFISTITTVLYAIIYFFYLSVNDYKCTVVYADDAFKLWYPQGAIGHFVHILWQIVLAALMFYFVIVVNSHAMDFDASRVAIGGPASDPQEGRNAGWRRRRRKDDEGEDEPDSR